MREITTTPNIFLLVTEPGSVFRDRASVSDAHWGAWLWWVPVAAHAVLASTAGALFLNKTVRDVPLWFSTAIIAADTILLLAYFALIVGVFVVVDAVTTTVQNRSGRRRALIECLGVSYWVGIPWVVAGVIYIMTYSPHPNPPGGALPVYAEVGAIGALDIVTRARERIPYISTIEMIDGYFALWVIALQCCALRVVSEVRVRTAVAVGVVLGFLFVIVPWALARLGANMA